MALQLVPFNHVYTDYEFVGDLKKGPGDCSIWHIGAVKTDGSQFEAFINVETNKETHEGCVELTEDYLKEHNATTFMNAFHQFVRWVGPQAIIISHNCFKSDKLVIESECKKHGVYLPSWYFYDSLLFLRSQIQCISYRLPDVYQQVLGREFEETHTALKDALGLKEILDVIQPHGLYMYPKYLTPLQNIKWVGLACEDAFIQARVRSVEDLILQYMQWVQLDGCVLTLMKQFLSRFELPCHDLNPIAQELIQNWLPKTHGGQI